MPLSRGNTSKYSKSIKLQLDRHSNLFTETDVLFKTMNENFKKTNDGTLFFEAYDEFTSEKNKIRNVLKQLLKDIIT